MNFNHEEKNKTNELIKKKIPISTITDEYLYCTFGSPISNVNESGRKRTTRNIKHTNNSEPIVKCNLLTNLGRCPVIVVFLTKVLSLADAKRVIEAITKPKSTPDMVETAEAIGCISFADKADIDDQAL